VSPTLATFLIELVNFLLLAGLLGWLLFKPVRAMLLARKAAEQKQAADLAARQAEIDQAQTESRARTAAFEREMNDARATRLAAAEREAATILARARESAEREQQRATQALAHVEQAELEKLAAAVAAASREAITRLLAAIDAPDLEVGLVRAACRQLQNLDGSLGAVVVESAKPLADHDRDAIAAAFGARATSCVFRVMPDLGAGVRIMTARGLVDASAAGMAAEIERRLNARLVTTSQEPA
jgi:F-type H+-transporting ATPase subunit b